MRTKPVMVRVFALLLTMSCAGAAHAACTVTSSAVAFGTYNPASSANVDVLSNVNVRCNPSGNVKFSVGLGNGTGARYSTGRKMTRTAGGGTVTYNLYINSERTTVLGDGTDGSLFRNSSGTNLNFQVFGRIRGSQPTVQAGSYIDTVIVTVSY